MTYNIHKGIRAAVSMYNRNHGTQIDPDLAIKIMHAESSGNPNAFGKKDGKAVAFGLMMLTPAIAKHYNVDYNDPRDNVRGGIKFIGDLWQKYKGSHDLVVAAYNAGEPQVDSFIKRFYSDPLNRMTHPGEALKQFPIKETRDYHKTVIGGVRSDGTTFNPSLSDNDSPVIAGTRSNWDTAQQTKVTQAYDNSPHITDNERAELGAQSRLGRNPLPLNKDDHYKNSYLDGIKVGLAKGSEAATIAKNQNINMNSPGFLTGYMTTKVGKAGMEFVATNGLMSLIPGGQLAGVAGFKKLESVGKEIAAITRLRQSTGGAMALNAGSDFIRAGAAVGGANLATNVIGETASYIAPGTNYKNQAELNKALGSIGWEAAGSGVLAGGLNAVISPWVRRNAQQLGSTQVANNMDALTTQKAQELMSSVENADDVAKKTLEKIAKAHYSEEKPLKEALDLSAKNTRTSKDVIPLADFSDEFLVAIEEADKAGGATSSLAGNSYVKNIRELMNFTADRNPRAGVKVADLPEIRKNIKQIIIKGNAGESPQLEKLSEALQDMKASDMIASKLPEDYKIAREQWRQHKIKWGDPRDELGSYNNLNKVYKSYKPGEGLKMTGAHARELLTDSAAESRAMNNKIGEFVDNSIIEVDDIAKVFQGDAAKHAHKGSTYRERVGPGDVKQAESYFTGQKHPQSIIDDQAISQELLPVGKLVNRGDVSNTQFAEQLPDIKKFATRLGEKGDAMSASLGNKGRAEATNIKLGSNIMGGARGIQAPVGRTLGNMQKITNIAESRLLPSSVGGGLQITPYSELSQRNALEFAKKARNVTMYGIEPARELGPDFASMLLQQAPPAYGPLDTIKRLFHLSATKGPNG